MNEFYSQMESPKNNTESEPGFLPDLSDEANAGKTEFKQLTQLDMLEPLFLIEKEPFVVKEKDAHSDLVSNEDTFRSLNDISELTPENTQRITDWVQKHLESQNLDEALSDLNRLSKESGRYLDIEFDFDSNKLNIKLLEWSSALGKRFNMPEQIGDTIEMDYKLNEQFDNYNPNNDNLLDNLPLDEITAQSTENLGGYLQKAHNNGFLRIAVDSINRQINNPDDRLKPRLADRILMISDYERAKVVLRINDLLLK